MNNDPKGYYARLGVQPNASEKLIRAAYRILAQEIHPDLNKAPNANEEFQRLGEAYSILSDIQRRRVYDETARNTDSQSTPAKDQTEKKQANNWQPFPCDRCGSISALPRYREYRTVKGLLLTAIYTNERGVYCSKCDSVKAFFATGITAFFGWWSLQGLFYSPISIWNNLTASSRFNEKTVRLLAHQAGYFSSRGKAGLAAAIAEEVLRLAPPYKMTQERRRREKLGYTTVDPMKEVKDFAQQLISAQSDTPIKTVLKREQSFANRRIGLQMTAVLAAFSIFCIGINYVNQQKEASQAKKMAAESERLYRAGIEEMQARKIAENQRSALDAARRPLPPTGLIDYDHPSIRYKIARGEQLPQLKIRASQDTNYLVKLEDVTTHNSVMRVFVRAGETAVVDVPFGLYRIKLASGSSWFGETIRFGPNTSYFALDRTSEFKREGDTLIGQEVQLVPVRNGNLSKTSIKSDQF